MMTCQNLKQVEAQYYYHVSRTRFRSFDKNTKCLYPRSYGINRASNEPRISRICVAPSIEHCLIAVGNLCVTRNNKTYVYRTKNKVVGILPTDVDDAEITQERWLIRPTKFIFYCEINISEKLFNWLNIAMLGTPLGILQQKKSLIRLKKYFLTKGYYV